MTGDIGRHWVLLETGGNQAYIFGTNRLRHVVGASDLIRELGTTWVRDAARRHDAEEVVAISGKGLLLVADPAKGRAVISEVSARALADAPGLEVTGVVGPRFDAGLRWRPGDGDQSAGPDAALTHVEALERTYELIEHARMSLPSALVRDPLLPWFDVCPESGFPVAGIEEQHPDAGPVSAAVLKKARARFRARDRMKTMLRDIPDVVPDDGEPSSNGWVAVIHADGNGIGKMFTDFPERALRAATSETPGGLTLERHKHWLSAFTSELESVTHDALTQAVGEAVRGKDARGAILPVVVGGDDVTVVCDARFALDLARSFAVAFEKLTGESRLLTAIAGEPLTASAGIAYVKPHHPFSAAYSLAQELTASAKQVNTAGRPACSALDFHVAFESTLAELSVLRQRAATPGITRHGGPYIITPAGGERAGRRDIAELDHAIATVRALSSSMAHFLREGLARGREEYQRRINLTALSPDLPDRLRQDVRRLAPADGVVRLLDALLLNAIDKPKPSGPAQPARSGDADPALAGVRP